MRVRISFGNGSSHQNNWPDIPGRREAGAAAKPKAVAAAGNATAGSRAREAGNSDGEGEVMAELEALVGLENVKQMVRELRAYARIQKKRLQNQLPAENLVMHMVFRGNPGTGKTTVARIIGRLFKEMQVLSKGHLVEVERADLVGEYVGHTAQRTREQVKKAQGGVLFIDEAYSLARGGGKDFGREAIDVLVRAMENYRDQFALILAGYREEMDWFIRTNPGLQSRFSFYLDFPDYTVPELLQIARQMLAARQYVWEPEAEIQLERILRRKVLGGEARYGNARLVRNIIEAAIRRQALRLVNKPHLTREELMLLRAEDLPPEAGQGRASPAAEMGQTVETIAWMAGKGREHETGGEFMAAGGD